MAIERTTKVWLKARASQVKWPQGQDMGLSVSYRGDSHRRNGGGDAGDRMLAVFDETNLR